MSVSRVSLVRRQVMMKDTVMKTSYDERHCHEGMYVSRQGLEHVELSRICKKKYFELLTNSQR